MRTGADVNQKAQDKYVSAFGWSLRVVANDETQDDDGSEKAVLYSQPEAL